MRCSLAGPVKGGGCAPQGTLEGWSRRDVRIDSAGCKQAGLSVERRFAVSRLRKIMLERSPASKLFR